MSLEIQRYYSWSTNEDIKPTAPARIFARAVS
jgi:hypothetical protein